MELEKGQCVYRSSFHLCILTYSPFVNFLTEIIVKLIDEVKIKRMQEYSARPKEFINLDIRYFAKELKPLIN